jgi:hypothetical protein
MVDGSPKGLAGQDSGDLVADDAGARSDVVHPDVPSATEFGRAADEADAW